MIKFFQKVLDFFKSKPQLEPVKTQTEPETSKFDKLYIDYITTKVTPTGIEFYYLYKKIYKSKSKKIHKAWLDFENSFWNSHTAKKIRRDIQKTYGVW